MTLDDKIRDVLARLSMLADGDTQNLDAETAELDHHGKADSKPPPGVELRSSDQPPSKERRSLYEWYSWHFDRTEDPDRRLSLYLLAEIDYQDFRFRADWRTELRKGELDDRDATDGGAAERAAAERVIDWYEGKPALLVAMLERTTEAWVKKARRQHDRNPVDGRPIPEFLQWDDDRRRREVAAQVAKGRGKKAAAKALGVNPDTVRRYWPEEAVAAA